MVFSGAVFLYAFLPLTFAVYALAPQRGRNAVLLIASLLFYAFGEPVYVLLLLLSSVSNWALSLCIERRRGTRTAKLALAVSVLLNLGLLGFFKYADFFLTTVNGLFGLSLPLTGVRLPLGISFYTFQTMSYTIDVYRGHVRPQRNLATFATFVCLFPQLIAGPIVRYSDIEAELHTRRFCLEDIGTGARRFTVGLGKKVLLANVLGELVSSAGNATVLGAWLGAVGYLLQIYFDFSGYSDMAIGLGRMFGFTFPENFDYPYLARSVTDFWRRWHQTLGQWFRDYVYIPLGGSRTTRAKWIRNVAVVWLLTGLWHGAAWNFVVWGLLNAFFILLAEEFKPVSQRFRAKHERLVSGFGYRVFETLRTFLLMCSLRVLDCYRDVEVSFRALGTVFTDFNWGEAFSGALLQLGLTGADYIIAAVGVVIMFAVSCVQEKHGSVREVLWEKPVLCYAVFFVLAVAVLTFGAYGVGYDAAQFIYNQF